MAKAPAKTATTDPAKPKLSFKEMMDLAAIGDASTGTAAPASTPGQPSLPIGEQAGKKSGATPEAPTPAVTDRVPATKALTTAGGEPGPPDELVEGLPDEAPSASLPAAEDKLDLATLFVPSPGKKPISVRITDDHQHFFTLLGHTVGEGASATTIIHNLLTDFRNKYEPELTKLMRKRMSGKR